jgi:hypothetical protein
MRADGKKNNITNGDELRLIPEMATCPCGTRLSGQLQESERIGDVRGARLNSIELRTATTIGSQNILKSAKMSSVMPHAYTPDAIRGMLSGRGTPRFSFDVTYGEHRLLSLERLPLLNASCAFVKSVGELDAGKAAYPVR